GGGAGVGYTINKDGKAVALRRRPQELEEPQGDVRFRSSAPQPGRMLTQNTGLPPRAGTGARTGSRGNAGGNAAGQGGAGTPASGKGTGRRR
ncbi:MAG: YgiQ family radical SAM protein, partial [Acidovorax sp.]